MNRIYKGMLAKVPTSVFGLMALSACTGGGFAPAAGYSDGSAAVAGLASANAVATPASISTSTPPSAPASTSAASSSSGATSNNSGSNVVGAGSSSGSSSGPVTSGSKSNSKPKSTSLAKPPVVPGAFPQSSTVCSPQGGGQTVVAFDYVNGLEGRLYSLNPRAPVPSNLSQLFANSTDAGVNLFLDDLNVPTRLFTEGFPAADGNLLKDGKGQPLLEWFGMDVYSEIQLSMGDVQGPYQLAILADDGANLMIKTLGNNDFTKLIDDDGIHPTKMSCATSPLVIHSYDRIPIHMQYYQGPRYEIALQLMWRPWPKDPSAVNDPLCGTEGNNQFFDPNQVPSQPLQNYNDLLARGWKPLKPSNYVIPEQGFNPCHVSDYWQLGRHH